MLHFLEAKLQTGHKSDLVYWIGFAYQKSVCQQKMIFFDFENDLVGLSAFWYCQNHPNRSNLAQVLNTLNNSFLLSTNISNGLLSDIVGVSY